MLEKRGLSRVHHRILFFVARHRPASTSCCRCWESPSRR
jgi:hypothetical protein